VLTDRNPKFEFLLEEKLAFACQARVSESRFGQGFAKVPEELYTKSFEYRLLVRIGKREEAKAGINNQSLITRFSIICPEQQ
jgi:hypothetical protein